MGPSHPPHAMGCISPDFAMVFLSSSYGFPGVFLWFANFFQLVSCSIFLRFDHGFLAVFQAFSAVCLWFSDFFLMVSCGFSHGFPAVFLRFSCGFPIAFLWFPSGFPMVIICFARASATSPLRGEKETPAALTSAQSTGRWTEPDWGSAGS